MLSLYRYCIAGIFRGYKCSWFSLIKHVSRTLYTISHACMHVCKRLLFCESSYHKVYPLYGTSINVPTLIKFLTINTVIEFEFFNSTELQVEEGRRVRVCLTTVGNISAYYDRSNSNIDVMLNVTSDTAGELPCSMVYVHVRTCINLLYFVSLLPSVFFEMSLCHMYL